VAGDASRIGVETEEPSRARRQRGGVDTRRHGHLEAGALPTTHRDRPARRHAPVDVAVDQLDAGDRPRREEGEQSAPVERRPVRERDDGAAGDERRTGRPRRAAAKTWPEAGGLGRGGGRIEADAGQTGRQ
jgi:hypothetical protein